jgi:leader peptidase (prepilin peptidase)/N-methyltransferase
MSEFVIIAPLVYLLIIGFPLALIDMREHRLPNRLTLSSALLAAVAVLWAAFLTGEWERSLLALTIGLATFLIGWLLAAKNFIGMGDIKLLISLNTLAGYFYPLLPVLSMTLGFVLASVVSGLRLLLRKIDAASSIALGPYLLLGFYLSVYPTAAVSTAEALS